jgi:hypothetical protein
MGDDGDRRYVDGGAARPGCDWGGRSRKHRVFHDCRFRDGFAARPRPTRGSGVWCEAARRVSPLADRWRVVVRSDRDPDGRPVARADCLAQRMGAAAGRPAADAPVSGHPHMESSAVAALRRVPAVLAGDGNRAAGHGDPDHREPGQRGCQLDAHLRALRCAGHGRAWVRMGHPHCARLHGGGVVSGDR